MQDYGYHSMLHTLLATVATAEWRPRMGNFSMTITCAGPETQQLFDLGLNLAFNFNQLESQRAFNLSIASDASCAMCWWGLAYAHAPFLNHPIKGSTDVLAGFAAATHAASLAASSTLSAKEAGLIGAAAVRFPSTASGNQTLAALAYEAKLKELSAVLPSDPDIATWYAEAVMLLECAPDGYHFYHADGSPTRRTVVADRLLRQVLQSATSHPFAHHLFIHLVEPSTPSANSSSGAGRALPSAEVLAAEFAGTDAQHLLHMPTHAYLRSGRYGAVPAQNIAAHAADVRLLDHGLLPYGPAHNVAFGLYGACMAGQRAIAYDATANLTAIYAAAPDRSDGPGPELGWNLRLTTRLRFGAWMDVVGADPYQPRPWPYARVLRHYANGTALARLGRKGGAFAQYKALVAMLPALDGAHAKLGIVARLSLRAALDFADRTAAGLAAAISALEAAVAEQASWAYDEPPAWHMPMRQCLGVVLLQAGELARAHDVFTADLAEFPRNGYGLWGLWQSMRAQPRSYTPEQVDTVHAQVLAAWKGADVPLKSSCLAFDG